MTPRYTATCLIAFFIGALTLSAASAAVVTLDTAAKSASVDVKTIELKKVRAIGEQIGLYVQSTIEDPRTVTFKATGLKDEKYDVYVNGAYIGQKTGPELAKGMDMAIPGSIADPSMMRCLNAIRKTLPPAWEHLVNNKEPGPKRVFNILDQALDTAKSGLNADRAYRSFDVVIAPAGTVLERMTWLTRLDAEGTARSVTHSLWLLQKMRARLYEAIADGPLRDPAIAALTPVEFTASHAAKNGKTLLDVAITNNSDLPVAGSVTAELPKGWKTGGKTADFKDLKSGKTAKLSIPLVRPASGGDLSAGVSVTARLTVVQGSYLAKFDVKTIATSAAKPAAATGSAPVAK